MTGWVEWLDGEIGPLRAGRRVLVLCRTRATLSLVRRWAARRGGVLGLEAATPMGLAQQVHQEPILAGPRPRRIEEDALPVGTRMGERIGGRPGLAGVARRWVQHVRLTDRVGRAIAAPEWLRELVDTGFGVDENLWALEGLLAAVEARGKRLSASAAWDRVVPLGFDGPAATRGPHEDWLVAKLSRRPARPAEPEPAPIPAREVPDVAAEARLAVILAAADPHRTSILVSDLATARRVRDALARSGIPCGWRDSEALAVHELASAVQRCAPWFAAPPDPPIPLADLIFVLGRTALGRKLHPAAEAAAIAFAPEATPTRPTRSSVKSVLERTRLLDGPLSAWRARVREQLGGSRAAEAAQVLVRLELLHAALSSRPVDEVLSEALGTPLAFDPDDFDDVIATLLGDDRPATSLPPGDRLGALQRFLLACRVRIHDDPVARAIVGALRDRAEWPVSPSHVHHALAGAVDLGVLSDGVDVITVDDYDDRPCHRLIVLDVHDHGLTRRPSPDPLLEDSEIGGLGAPTGRDLVDARLAQVHRAVARATEAVAIVTRRDPNGREVVPPIQLDLRWQPGRIPSYGLGLKGLPEAEPRLLRAVLDPAEPPAPARHPEAWIRHLADQATVEWYRDGRGPPTFPAVEERGAGTLADLRRAEVPLAPAHVLPYLGHAEQVPEAALPERAHSVSRLILPLAHCGYQAFARVVLGISEKREVADDLDPAEVGTAVHQALEQVTPDARWRGTGMDPAALVDRLQEATRKAFGAAVDGLALSAARRTSVDGHRDRWNEHWRLYVESRSLPPANPGIGKVLDGHPALPEWVDRLRTEVPALRHGSRRRINEWLLWAVRIPPDELLRLHDPVFLQDGEWFAMPSSALPDLKNVVASPDWGSLHPWFSELVARMDAWSAPPHSTAAEVPFGEAEDVPPAVVGGSVPEGTTFALGPTVLKLGQTELSLRGRIDRVDFLTGPTGRPFVGVVDYKTGKPRNAWSFRADQMTLRDPQLLVYAMVIERASREDRLPEPLRKARVSAVAHDRVRQALLDPEAADRRPKAPETWLPVDTRLLGWAAGQLGVLVDDAREGRWTLRPRADTCPMLSSYSHDYCPVAKACRLRALPGGFREEDK